MSQSRPGDGSILSGTASNQGHGLKRTNADKRSAVEVVLNLHPEWSDRRIAEFVGVGDDLVRTVRPDQVPESGTCEPAKRVGKDSKSYAVPPKPAPESAGTERKTPPQCRARVRPESAPSHTTPHGVGFLL